MMRWDRWLFKIIYLSCTSILITYYMTRTICTMYIEELKKEFSISVPANSTHFFGVTGNVYKPAAASNNPYDITSIPTFSQITGKQTSTDKEFITPERLMEIKQHMTPDDKKKIYSLISTKIPQDDIQKISYLMEGGITADKLNEIQKILKQYFNEQEYSELTSVFSKY